MATYSQVKAGLDDIARAIRAERDAMKQGKTRLTQGRGNLDAIPATFKDVLDTINAYPSNTTDAAEKQAKAELAKLTSEFVALRAAADNAITSLASITEF